MSLGPFHSRLFRRWCRFPFAWIVRCRRWSRRPGPFYVLQIFLWTASFRVNTEIVAWSTIRRILWRFLTCVCHAFFSMWRSCPGYVLKVYYWWRTCLWLAFRKQFEGKAYLKINLLVKTPLHRRSMEVRCSELWAPGTLHYQLFAVIDLSCVGEKTFRIGQFLGDLYTVRQFQTFGIKRVM